MKDYNISKNRLWNTKNPNQGEAMKVLCVCSAGLLRSPTMANVLHGAYGWNTRAVGDVASHALVPIDPVMVEWAEMVLTADDEQRDFIVREFERHVDGKSVISLDLPDQYEYMDPELQNIILNRVQNLS